MEEAPPGNGKALVSLIFGIFGFANLATLAAFMIFEIDALDDAGAWWMLMPLMAFTFGSAAAYLGSIAWIDVRRGVTDRRLSEARIGAILGGVTVGLMVLATIILIVAFIVLMIAFGGDGGGLD